MNLNHLIALADPFIDQVTGDRYVNVPVVSDDGTTTTHELALDLDDARA